MYFIFRKPRILHKYTNFTPIGAKIGAATKKSHNFDFTPPLRSYSFSGASVFSHSFYSPRRKLYQSTLSKYNEANRRGRRGLSMSNILSEVHPELVAEWSDKNLPLTPDRITYGSNKVVWWKGACVTKKNRLKRIRAMALKLKPDIRRSTRSMSFGRS